MSDLFMPRTRRAVLAASASAGADSMLPTQASAAGDADAIRPFRIEFSEEALVDLRNRINATKWPERGDGHG